jgi:hypothetical protein
MADPGVPGPQDGARQGEPPLAAIAMTSKPVVESRAAGTWATRARSFTRHNPGAVLIGAVALGFVLARAARHA